MLRFLVRRINHYEALLNYNKNGEFAEAINFYRDSSIPLSEQIKCREQYYYALKSQTLQLDFLSSSKSQEPAPETNQENPVLYINKQSRSTGNYADVLLFVSYAALAIFSLLRIMRGPGRDEMMDLINQSSMVHIAENSPFTFKDVRGIDDCREEMEDIVNYLKSPQKYLSSGAQMTKGVLLTGKPGTGKTLLAKAIAGEAGVKFFFCSGSEFEEVFVGLGAKRIRGLFEEAKKHAPCIIFIDEIDALAGNRNGMAGLYSKQSLNQLLIEMDGFATNQKVIIIGATNFPESLDPAIKRSGRFDKEIYIPVPDRKGRADILDLYLGKIKKSEEISSEDIARKTSGMTGAELANIVNLAALNAVKSQRTECVPDDFENAIDRTKMGLVARTYTTSEEEKMSTVYHELGHAMVGYVTKGAGEIHKVTILPRGNTLGHTSIIDTKETNLKTKEELLAIIDVCMGGRAAEECFFGEENVSNGCSSDLSNATSAAYYGLRSGLFTDFSGIMAFKELGELGIEQRNKIDEAVLNILQSSYERAKRIILEKAEILKKLAVQLKEKETLSKDEFVSIVNQ